MMTKGRLVLSYLLDRIKEPSTWQGLGFIVALCGSKLGTHLDWGQCAALGGIVSGVIKLIFPDVIVKKDDNPNP